MTATYGVPGTARRAGLPQTTCDCGRVPSSQRTRPDEIGPLYLDAHGTVSSMTLAACVRTSQTIVSLYVFHLRCDRSGSPDLRDDAGLRRGWYGDHRRDIDSSRKASTHSHLDWSALVRRRTRLRPSSDHLVRTYTSCRLLRSASPTDSPSFPCSRSRPPPEHARVRVVSLLLHFVPRSRRLLQLSPFAGSSKSRSRLRLRTSRRTIAIARAVDTPR